MGTLMYSFRFPQFFRGATYEERHPVAAYKFPIETFLLSYGVLLGNPSDKTVFLYQPRPVAWGWLTFFFGRTCPASRFYEMRITLFSGNQFLNQCILVKVALFEHGGF